MLRVDNTKGNLSFKSALFMHSTVPIPYKVEGKMRKAVHFTEGIGKMDAEMSKDIFQSRS